MFNLVWRQGLAVTALGGLLAVSGFADCRKKQDLTPTAQGAAMDTSGNVDLRAQGTQQKFKVSMEADAPNGSIYVVRANGLAMGTIRLRLGQGELDINTNDGDHLPNALGSVCNVTAVAVSDATGNVVLNGSF